MWNIIKIAFGAFLMLVTIVNLRSAAANAAGSTAYLIGYLTGTLLLLVIGVYLIYSGITSNKSNN
ncbi:MAG TPA: hypothetical protein VNB22_16430 [Pyrinomonadaceae bacterium]|jgi:hypothetical protein|nr:hypothetical protein [Pyrinomonadaceae bacterium]